MTVKEIAFPLPYIPPALAPVVLFFYGAINEETIYYFPACFSCCSSGTLRFQVTRHNRTVYNGSG